MNSCSAITRRALGLGLFALTPFPALAQNRAQPRALSTVAMVGDLVRDIGGDRIRPETLIWEGVDPHLFRPTRADTARLLAADIIFANGHRLEGRMGDVLARAAANGKPVVMVAETLPRANLRANPDYPDAADPHVWMDPVLWAEASGSIAMALARLMPDQAGVFEANLAALRQRLAALHDYGARVMASIPARQRLLVTAHDAFGYFSARYGLEVDSIQGLSTESEANLARIEAIVRSLVDRRIPAVFAETSVPDRAVRALIEGAGARGQRVALGGTLFSDSMGKPGTYEGTYHGMLDHNFTTIARALGGEAPARGMLGRLAAA
ncbi:MAG: zinc ABC transporter substrate-binding protein [Roseomonas sp.]|nr:zinc ABC transporter substrate-binding protein [Roseomonas sp.]MCA3406711.1 zinc ABC transporter substrate-binding protein [Roseomonas sp.]